MIGRPPRYTRTATLVHDATRIRSDDIITLMAQTNLVVSEVTARREAIHRLLVEATEVSRALTSIVNSTKGDLKPALEDLNDVLDFLNKEDDTLTRVLDVMAPAVRYVANAAGNGPWPRSEEHTSELQSLMRISYAVF